MLLKSFNKYRTIKIVWYFYSQKNWIPCRTLVVMATKKKNFKNIFLIKRKPYSLYIQCVALSYGSLPRFIKLCPCGQHWPRPGSRLISIKIYCKTFKPQALELRYSASSFVGWFCIKIAQRIESYAELLLPWQHWGKY